MSSRATALSPAHELVRGETRIQDLPGGLRTRNRQTGRTEKTQLNEHGCLIPVDVLVGKLPVAELDDHDEGDLHSLAGRRHARETSLPLHGVRAAENELVGDTD